MCGWGSGLLPGVGQVRVSVRDEGDAALCPAHLHITSGFGTSWEATPTCRTGITYTFRRFLVFVKYRCHARSWGTLLRFLSQLSRCKSSSEARGVGREQPMPGTTPKRPQTKRPQRCPSNAGFLTTPPYFPVRTPSQESAPHVTDDNVLRKFTCQLLWGPHCHRSRPSTRAPVSSCLGHSSAGS